VAANRVAVTSSTFTATTWPMRDVWERVTFMAKMGSSPHIGRTTLRRQPLT
jgi:hypothetical protein